MYILTIFFYNYILLPNIGLLTGSGIITIFYRVCDLKRQSTVRFNIQNHSREVKCAKEC